MRTDLLLPEVLEDHLGEAEFLLEQWDNASRSPGYDLDELGETIECRLEAHLDALFVAGPTFAEGTLVPELRNEEEPRRAFVAARVLAAFDNETWWQEILTTAAESKGPVRPFLIRALASCSSDSLTGYALSRIGSPIESSERAVCWEVLSAWGVLPDADLGEAIRHADPLLCSAALLAARRFGRIDCLGAVDEIRRGDDSNSTEALRTAVMLGSEKAWADLLERAEVSGADSSVLALVALVGSPVEQDRLIERLSKAERLEECAWLSGYVGTRHAGDLCADLVTSEDERVRGVAADSMGWIGGFDLQDDRFAPDGQRSADEEAALPDLADEPEDVALDGVEELPLFVIERVVDAWQDRRQEVENDVRRVFGRPHAPESMLFALRTAPLWRRHLVAQELAIRTRGKAWISTQAFARQQKRQLGAMGEVRFGQSPGR